MNVQSYNSDHVSLSSTGGFPCDWSAFSSSGSLYTDLVYDSDGNCVQFTVNHANTAYVRLTLADPSTAATASVYTDDPVGNTNFALPGSDKVTFTFIYESGTVTEALCGAFAENGQEALGILHRLIYMLEYIQGNTGLPVANTTAFLASLYMLYLFGILILNLVIGLVTFVPLIVHFYFLLACSSHSSHLLQ